MIRVGQGFDVHQLVEGRKCIIGGVTIPYEKGLLGHSDADVLLHAISDAILGALGLGDIGKHFPDTAAEFKDADSLSTAEAGLAAGEGQRLSSWEYGLYHHCTEAENGAVHPADGRNYCRCARC